MNDTIVYGHLEWLDYLIISFYLLACVIIGVSLVKRGTKDTSSYFIGSGSIPRWMTGISLLAACFAADTPLWIGDMIYKRGIEGVWLYWATAVGTAFFVILTGPLWRRTGVMTDLEFLEMRYSGKPASVLRGTNSVFYSVFMNLIFLSVAALSMSTILQASTGLSKFNCMLIAVIGALIYTAISGMWGIVAVDLMHGVVTFGGSVVLGLYAIHNAGGTGALAQKIYSLPDWTGNKLNIIPRGEENGGLPFMTLLFLFTLGWVQLAGFGQYIAQKLFTTKSPRQASFTAMVWGGIYYSFIPMPWIVTIVASKIMLPDLAEGQQAYPRMAMTILPMGLKGVLMASLLAAFLSTYAALLNWGASYAVNDIYQRFIVKHASQHHYVRVGQIAVVPMVIISVIIAYFSTSILNLLFITLVGLAGYFTVSLGRWLWWRVNAWSEIAAIGSSVFFFIVVCVFFPKWMQPEFMEQYYGHRMFFVMLCSFAVWVIVTLLTKPVDKDVLNSFYKKVRPPGFWGPVRERLGMKNELTTAGILYGWACMLLTIFAPVVGMIKLMFGQTFLGLNLIALGFVGLILVIKRVKTIYED